MGYGKSDAIDGFSYRLSVGVNFFDEQYLVGPILCIGSGMGSQLEAVLVDPKVITIYSYRPFFKMKAVYGVSHSHFFS
jgi:hypothetical protein